MKNCLRLLGVSAGVATFAALAAGFVHVETFVIVGDDAGDQFGTSVSAAGDVNRDGFGDVVIGAPSDEPNGLFSGSARIVSGFDGSTLRVFEGAAEGDEFGSSVSGTGDVNRDGFDDVVVVGGGTAYVFSGADGTTLHTFSPATLVGRAGDVNDDGWDDVLVGAVEKDPGRVYSGTVRVYSGKDGTGLLEFRGDGEFDAFGYSVAGAGDVNGDGHDDVIVGAPGSEIGGTGYAVLYSGADGSVLRTFKDGAAGDDFAVSVAGAGDVNGDGVDDVIVGSNKVFFESGPSYVRVYSGRDGAPLHTFYGGDESYEFGSRVAGGGDVNGDGYADVIVGVRWRARVVVFSGRDGARLYDLRSPESDFFGESVALADLNADGYADLIVGAPLSDANGEESGRVSIRLSDPGLEDEDPPLLSWVSVGRYVLPGDDLRLGIESDDGPGGSGVTEAKVSFDGGTTWTDWVSANGGTKATIPGPGIEGLVDVAVVVRDARGNESAPVVFPLYFMESDPPDVSGGGKVSGTLSARADVDVVSLYLLAGDSLTVKLEAKSAEKGKRLDPDLELLYGDGSPAVLDRFPRSAPRPGITGFVPLHGDRFRIVVRNPADSEAQAGTYRMKLKVKRVKWNRKAKAVDGGNYFTFEMFSGTTLKGRVVGTGLEPSAFTLVGPDGVNPCSFSGSETRVKFGPTVLERGFGTYTLDVAPGWASRWKFRFKPPKRPHRRLRL